jgi:hypothetical protein
MENKEGGVRHCFDAYHLSSLLPWGEGGGEGGIHKEVHCFLLVIRDNAGVS